MTPADIKQARQTLGLSQSAMSRALGLTSVMTYSKWETGERAPNAAAIASIEMLLYMQRQGVLTGWLEQQEAV